MEAMQTYNLTKTYGNKTVVDHINLSVKKGTIFGFLGKNGAGKSTFINMITGLIHPTSGSFEILGHPAGKLKDIQQAIGVLPDYSTFYDDFTALDHLKYFSKLLHVPFSKQELIAILERVGLEDAIHVKAKNFSFGMKKKLGIAQALINQPEILFLDEPTSGVDANAVLNIHSIIDEIAAKGTTIFLTSHNLNEVEKLCDEIAIMNQGVIQKQGNMKQLRDQFSQEIIIHIQHRMITEEEQQQLKTGLCELTDKLEIGETNSEIVVSANGRIPQVNKWFVQHDIDVFRLEVDEPSLEEIFLQLE